MTKYALLVACRDLKNDDGSSAKISVIRAEGDEDEIGQTAELMGDTPVFDKVFEFDCDNTDDLVKVTILDENDQSRGVATFPIASVLEHEKSLGFMEMSANRGAVVVLVVEKIEEGTLKLKLKAKDLKNVEGFTNLRKPDPFYEISKLTGRRGGRDQWAKVCISHPVKDELDPSWEETAIAVKDLCEGDYDMALKIEVFDEERGDHHVIIGSLVATVNQLVATSGGDGLRLEEGGELTGTLFVESAKLEGCVNSVTDAKSLMKIVAVALQSRSDANEKTEAMEKLKEEAAAAKQLAEAAQLEAEQKAQAVEAAAEELAKAVAAAEDAEAVIGGLE